MGGSASSPRQDTSSDATSLPSTSKSPKPAKKSISRLKLSFKRKTTSRDRTRPFQDLIKSWPVGDFDLLLAEFEADSRLLSIRKQCDLARKVDNFKFADDFLRERESLADCEILFKQKSIKVNRNFVNQRCKSLKIPENCEKFEILEEKLQIFAETEIEQFFEYLYTEKCDLDGLKVQKLKMEMGCQRKLADDAVQMWKADLKTGDLVIEVREAEMDGETPSTSTFEIRCSSAVASSRSRLIRSLLRRKMATKPHKICFDEHIFPRAFAQMFVFFLYSDVIDWQLIALDQMSVSSLSLAKAITSGRNPHVQLWKSLEIIQIARFFGVEAMVRGCEDIVVKNLSIDNVASVLQWSLENASKYITTHSIRLLESQFQKISTSTILFELEKEEMQILTSSQFLQTTELELLDACVRWGEHALLRRLEDREPNVVADTCHSISRRGVKRSDMDAEELKSILSPLTDNIRKEYTLPPFDISLNDAYSRGILEREPLRNDLITDNREINPDLHWLKPDPLSPGPRYYRPYHEVMIKASRGDKAAEKLLSVVPLTLEFRNLYPEILDDAKFQMAKDSIKVLVDEFDIKSLARRYHQNMALDMITRRVLIELDVCEECFDCHVATGKSTPPDVLPPITTGVFDIF